MIYFGLYEVLYEVFMMYFGLYDVLYDLIL